MIKYDYEDRISSKHSILVDKIRTYMRISDYWL